MMISLRHCIAFLAMPKTASSSIEAVLRHHADIQFTGQPEVKHIPFRKYQRFLPKLLETWGAEQVETVCLYREPIDWLSSWYRFRARPKIGNPAHSTKGISFDDFVHAWLDPKPPAYARVGRQSAFVSDKDGRVGVDHIFRYENFAGFAAFIGERLQAELTYPALNVSPKAEVTLSAPLRARVEAEAAEDFRIWAEIAR